LWLARPEGDDAAYGIVRRDAYGDAIPWHYLDTKAAHPAAQLCQHFVARVALDPVEPSTVHCHHGALHVNQVVLAQKLAFPAFLDDVFLCVFSMKAVNNCATYRAITQIGAKTRLKPSKPSDGLLDLSGERLIIFSDETERFPESHAHPPGPRHFPGFVKDSLEPLDSHGYDRDPQT
jgi:hypothetical protein